MFTQYFSLTLTVYVSELSLAGKLRGVGAGARVRVAGGTAATPVSVQTRSNAVLALGQPTQRKHEYQGRSTVFER